jgi:S-formylglutathione hydrolase
MLTGKLNRLAIGLLLALSPAALAQEAAKAPAGRVVEAKIEAASLKGNLLRDPATQSFAIYLPPGYDTSPSKRFPSLYLLHGFLRDNTDWTTAVSIKV